MGKLKQLQAQGRMLGWMALHSRDPVVRLMRMKDVGNPYPLYSEIRTKPYRHVLGGEVVVSTYAGTDEVLRDVRYGKDQRLMAEVPAEKFDREIWSEGWIDDAMTYHMLLNMDAPDHTRLRRLVGKAFSRPAVGQLETRVQELVDQRLDRMDPSKPIDVIADLAFPIPMAVICALLGVPVEDEATFRSWGKAIIATSGFNTSKEASQRSRTATLEFAAYFHKLLEARRANPGSALIDELISVEEQGEMLTEAELLATCLLLLLAGFETTVNLIGNGTLALLRHPEQADKLRGDPSLMPNAIEELLRFDSPIQFTSRIALEDIDYEGATIKRGRQMLTLLGSANRDPSVFEDPDHLDITRDNASKHLSFASGTHFCLGAALARLEGRVAIGGLLQRFEHIELATENLAWRPNPIFHGLEELPITAG